MRGAIALLALSPHPSMALQINGRDWCGQTRGGARDGLERRVAIPLRRAGAMAQDASTNWQPQLK